MALVLEFGKLYANILIKWGPRTNMKFILYMKSDFEMERSNELYHYDFFCTEIFVREAKNDVK